MFIILGIVMVVVVAREKLRDGVTHRAAAKIINECLDWILDQFIGAFVDYQTS